MQPDAEDLARPNDMLKAAGAVRDFILGKSYAEYVADLLLRSGVERQLEIVGEAARHISKAFQHAYPEIPWSLIIGQRHVLSHDYGEIKDERVWSTASSDIPELIVILKPLVPPPPAKE
jgi:uncharacterized protein with HEPN domain